MFDSWAWVSCFSNRVHPPRITPFPWKKTIEFPWQVFIFWEEMLRGNEHSNGCTDCGTEICYDSIPIAKEALVFMLNWINGSWKIPVGYFLIDGRPMSGEKSQGSSLHASNSYMDLVSFSLTFDRSSSNQTMGRTMAFLASMMEHMQLLELFLTNNSCIYKYKYKLSYKIKNFAGMMNNFFIKFFFKHLSINLVLSFYTGLLHFTF